MFKPEEWTKQRETYNGRIVYINEFTRLPKLWVTFTREQQDQLDAHAIRISMRVWE